MDTSEIDKIWRRALQPAGADGGAGDAALRALLAFHSAAMHGGVLHAVDTSSDEGLASARQAYRSLGFDEIAEMLAAPIAQDADSDELEEELDDHYAASIPTDETLFRALEAHVRANPGMYAPV